MNYSFADLSGKVAVMTGGTGVIGKALATAFTAAGIRLAIAGRDLAKTQKAANEVAAAGGTVIGIAFDVLDRASIETAHREIREKLGPVDLLINAAGGNRPSATTPDETMSAPDLGGSFFGLEPSGLAEVMDLNFTGTLLPTQIFGRDMVGRGGVILNLSSMSAFRPLTKVAGYSASKAAVNNLTQWLAVHLAPQNIRVNALAPGFFLTEQNRFLMLDAAGAPTARATKVLTGTPMGRFGEVAELTGAALYLLSDLSRFVTGIVLPVDGGFSAYSGV